MKYILVSSILLLCSCTFSINDSKEAQAPSHFNHVMLYVSDLDRSIEFYTKAFDLELTKRLDTLRLMQEDGNFIANPIKIALMKFPGQNFLLEIAERKSEAISNLHFQHLGIDVADIESSLIRAKEAGAISNRPISTVRADDILAKNTFLNGPDGESIELMQILEGEF